jgi:hypothetical protein
VPAADEHTIVNGLPVTSLERTIVDCACLLRPLPGLVVADAGARSGADPDVLRRLLAERTGRRGIATARALIELADDGAESPGKTATRFVVMRDGLPAPRTQLPVTTHLGTFWADMGWEEWRLLLEYDGRSKYEQATEALIQEKRRHDAIQDEGWRSVRVTKEDLRGTALTKRLLPFLPASVAKSLRPRADLLG